MVYTKLIATNVDVTVSTTNGEWGKECGGGSLCEHKIRKYDCRKYGGGRFCDHGNRKSFCISCGGAGICDLRKQTPFCKDCGGSALCKTPHCTTCKSNKYKRHCLFCFVHLFPNEPVARNYMMKENHVATFLKEKFPNITWKCDKRVEDGCSRRRPDLLLDMGSHIVIVEVDENSHDGYDPTCEEKHLGEIWGDVYHRKIVFVRFNTDEYKDEDGNNVPSPWGLNKFGLCTLRPKWKAA